MNLLDVELEKCYERLNVDIENGLSSKQVEKNRKDFCIDARHSKKRKNFGIITNFDDTIRIAFMVLSIVSYALFDNRDGLVSVILFAAAYLILSFVLDFISKKYGDDHYSKYCKSVVKRNGKTKKIASSELVPGDILILKKGDYVPCDGIIVYAENLRALEYSASERYYPATKLTHHQVVAHSPDNKSIEYNKCLLFYGTTILSGNALVVVMNTGKDIAENNKEESKRETKGETKEETKKSVEDVYPTIYGKAETFSRLLTLFWIIITTVYFVAAYFAFNVTDFNAFVFSILLAIASSSELLARFSLAVLNIQKRKLASKQIFLKRMSSLNFLSDVNCVTVHSSEFFYNGMFYLNKYLADDTPYIFRDNPDKAYELLLGSALTVSRNKEKAPYFNKKNIDSALLKLASDVGIKSDFLKKFIPIKTADYSERNEISYGLFLDSSEAVFYARGNPESIIKGCTSIYKNGNDTILTERDKFRLLSMSKDLADDNELVLAVGRRRFPNAPEQSAEEILTDMSFVGFLGLYTPINPDSAKAVNFCVKNGISVILMTHGDPNAAYGLAKSVSAVGKEDFEYAVTPYEYQRNDYGLFIADLQKYKVFCNLMPTEESEIIKAHQKDQDIVASVISGVEGIIPQAQSDVTFASISDDCGGVIQNADVLTMRKNLSAVPLCVHAAKNVCNNISRIRRYILYWQVTFLLTFFLTLICEHKIIFSSSSMIASAFLVAFPCAFAMIFDDIKVSSFKYDITGKFLSFYDFAVYSLLPGIATTILSELSYRTVMLLSESESTALSAFVLTIILCIFSASLVLRDSKNIKKNLLCVLPLLLGASYVASSVLIPGAGAVLGVSEISLITVMPALISSAITVIVCCLSKLIIIQEKVKSNQL